VEGDVQLVAAVGEQGGGLAADRSPMLEQPATGGAAEDLATSVDEVEPVDLRPGEQTDRLAEPTPAAAPVARLEQAVVESARRGREQAAGPERSDGNVDERAGFVELVPAAAAVGADEEPIAGGVVAVDALAGGTKDVEVRLAEKRDRLPALARVGRLDQAQPRRQVLLARLVDVRVPEPRKRLGPTTENPIVSWYRSPTRSAFRSPSSTR
jgi:hypothetical protein